MSNVDITSFIQKSLQDLEFEHQIRILYACESGSRAWGFPSQDSDYDVRFIYIHQPDWYLSIDDKRDVIEKDLEHDLDVSGWDIRKALRLFRKSNPPLLEWLQSPIVYNEDRWFKEKLLSLLPDYVSPRACMHHYVNMARNSFESYQHAGTVKAKKYFYTLRPILACLWLELEDKPVPTEFDSLLERIIADETLKQDISDLRAFKMRSNERDDGVKIPSIDRFIEEQLLQLDVAKVSSLDKSLPYEPLNKLFQNALKFVRQ